jgi:carbon storage regulator CsrA
VFRIRATVVLVLTRRSKDKISFPQVGITVHFIRVQAGQVKVGVDAPRDVAIIRDEVDDGATAEFMRRQLARLPREVRHGIRNELHEISVGLHLFRELVRANLPEEADETFAGLQQALTRLDQNEVLRRPEAAETEETSNEPIAVVEDDDNQRRLLADLLRMRGYQVLEFADGEEALDYFKENPPPGALLVDMRMPRRDGKSTVETLRRSEHFSSVPIFAVSGTSPEENGLSMGSQGVDRWFPKPLSVQALISAIDQSSASPTRVPA